MSEKKRAKAMQLRFPLLARAAQPGDQGVAGLRFGVFPLVRPPAPLSSVVGHPNLCPHFFPKAISISPSLTRSIAYLSLLM